MKRVFIALGRSTSAIKPPAWLPGLYAKLKAELFRLK
jgi:hypothetical protein